MPYMRRKKILNGNQKMVTHAVHSEAVFCWDSLCVPINRDNPSFQQKSVCSDINLKSKPIILGQKRARNNESSKLAFSPNTGKALMPISFAPY